MGTHLFGSPLYVASCL